MDDDDYEGFDVDDDLDPDSVRRFEALQVISAGGVQPPPSAPRPVVPGVFYRFFGRASPGFALVNLPLASLSSACLLAYLSAPPVGPGEFGGDVLWISCEVVERLSGDRLVVRLAGNARSERGERDFVVTGAQVFE